MPKITLPNGWQPRPYQKKLWNYLENGGKRAVAVWHRRSGKDDVDLNWTAVAALQRPATYWYMLPQAAQARKAVWEAINPHTGIRRIDQAFPKEIREATRENEMFIKFVNGSTWQVVGSDNYNSLVGSPPAGIVFSEWSLADPQAWAFMRPILNENGGWAVFNYTPRGQNHGLRTLELSKSEPEWFSQVLTVKDTGVFSPEALERERRELVAEYGAENGEAIFQQEYFCSFNAPIVGAYYAREFNQAEQDGRLTRVPWEAGTEVHTAWDLGISDSTAIWFIQRIGRETRVIDYYENSGCALDHYANILKQKPYSYGKHYLPHDTQIRELGTGKSRVETLQSLGIRATVVKADKVEDGINQVRKLLPTCWFDAEKCKRGLEALRQYRTEYDEKLKAFKNRPLHDWSSHGADAFRTFAMGHRDKSESRWEQPDVKWIV